MISPFSQARRRAVFGVCVFGYALSQFSRSFLTVIVDELGRDLGAGPRDLGAMGASWFLMFALAQFPVGVLLDRIGPRRTITGMMLSAIAGSAVFAGATTVFTAIIAMGLIGFGCAPILMGALYFFARTETPARFAALGSMFLGIGLIGGLLAAAPLAHFVSLLGWRAALSAMVIVLALATLLIGVVMRDPEQNASLPAGQDGGIFGALITLVKRPVMWPILAMSCFITAEVWTERALWVGPFFGDVHGLSAIERGDAILAFAIAMAASASLAGPIANRIDNPKLVAQGATMIAGGMFILLGIFPGMPMLASLVLICLVGLFGATYAVQIAHARQFMPPHVIGRGITFINFLSIGGTGVVQYLSGVAVSGMKAGGLPPAAIYGNLHLAFGSIMVVAAMIYSFAPAQAE